MQRRCSCKIGAGIYCACYRRPRESRCFYSLRWRRLERLQVRSRRCFPVFSGLVKINDRDTFGKQQLVIVQNEVERVVLKIIILKHRHSHVPCESMCPNRHSHRNQLIYNRDAYRISPWENICEPTPAPYFETKKAEGDRLRRRSRAEAGIQQSPCIPASQLPASQLPASQLQRCTARRTSTWSCSRSTSEHCCTCSTRTRD